MGIKCCLENNRKIGAIGDSEKIPRSTFNNVSERDMKVSEKNDDS